MHKFITSVTRDNHNEIVGFEYNVNLFNPIIEDLARNNTAFPNITKVVYSSSETKVFFADHTAVSVKRFKEDADNVETAIVYAIVKRLYGIPDKNGWINDHVAKNSIHRIIEKKLINTVKLHKELGRDNKKTKINDKKTDKKITKKNLKKSPRRDANGRFSK